MPQYIVVLVNSILASTYLVHKNNALIWTNTDGNQDNRCVKNTIRREIFSKNMGNISLFCCLVAVKRNSYITYIFWKKGAENGQGDLCRQSKRRRGQNNHLREPGDGAGTDRGKSLSDQNQE